RHGDRSVRLPAPAVLVDRTTSLSQVRTSNLAPVDGSDSSTARNAWRGRESDDPRSSRARTQRRVQERTGKAGEVRIHSSANRRRAETAGRRDQTGQAAQPHYRSGSRSTLDQARSPETARGVRPACGKTDRRTRAG